MASKDLAIWGIHAGRPGDAESLFLKEGLVALGWPELSDLIHLDADREAFKNYYLIGTDTRLPCA